MTIINVILRNKIANTIVISYNIGINVVNVSTLFFKLFAEECKSCIE